MGKKVLLVEDYPANILVATTLLEAFGYDYDTASTGLEALEKVKQERYQVILMDVQMQGMDGYETTRQIRQWEERNGLPPQHIIAMTAHALQGDREKCIEVGMDDYLSKPFNFTMLHDKLAAVSAMAA